MTDPRSLVVLLVEDNPADAELMAVRLANGGASLGATNVHLLHCCSASAACVLLHYRTVDVVILDLTLPDAHGLEALLRVRETSLDVPIIVLTGINDQALAVQALRAGAQDFVLKPPPDGATMRRILRYACERNRLLKELDVAMHDSARAATRWRLLAEVGRAFAGATSANQAVVEVSRLIVPEAADCFLLFLAGDQEASPVVEVGHIDPRRSAELSVRARAILDEPETARNLLVICECDSMRGGTLLTALNPLFAALQIVDGTAVPVRFGGRSRGFLLLGLTSPRPNAQDDAEFARSLADRIGMAIEQDRLLRQTQRAVEARDRAVSIVSHDLRNPLSTIQICANALLDPEPAPPSGIRHMAELISRSAEWMQHIVRDLLDRTNLDSGHLTLSKRTIVVSDILTAIEDVFGPIAAQRAIELVLNAEEDLPVLEADPDRLLQALANLMSNAMKFTPRGGRVELLATVELLDVGEPASPSVDRDIRFSVRDTGPGIAPENIDHVFDWFWRAPGGSSDGAGLGLGIAKALVEAHDARLHVDSVPGHGSTFWFTLCGSNAVPSFAELPVS